MTNSEIQKLKEQIRAKEMQKMQKNIAEVEMTEKTGVQHKTCGHCNNTKPITEFYNSPTLRLGVRNNCKECDKAACNKSRQKKLDIVAQIRAEVEAELKAEIAAKLKAKK